MKTVLSSAFLCARTFTRAFPILFLPFFLLEGPYFPFLPFLSFLSQAPSLTSTEDPGVLAQLPLPRLPFILFNLIHEQALSFLDIAQSHHPQFDRSLCCCEYAPDSVVFRVLKLRGMLGKDLRFGGVIGGRGHVSLALSHRFEK